MRFRPAARSPLDTEPRDERAGPAARGARLRLMAALVAAVCGAGSASAQPWSDKLTTTPVLIQDGFGPAGTALPFNGLAYCVPTSAAMSMEYLGLNGFTQLSPASPTAADA